MKVRFCRLQKWEGEGPERLELERSIEVTELVLGSQVIPYQLHGVSSWSFQVESLE